MAVNIKWMFIFVAVGMVKSQGMYYSDVEKVKV